MTLKRPQIAWLLTGCAALLLGGYESGLLRVRYFTALAVLFFAATFAVLRRALSVELWIRHLSMVSIILALNAGVAQYLDDPLYRWLPTAASLLIGTAWLAAWQAEQLEAGPEDTEPRRSAWVMALGFGVLCMFGGEWLASTVHLRSIDETWYLLQADQLWHGTVAGQYPEGQEALFGVKFGHFAEGRFVGQYVMGWPALLALPQRLGLQRWVSPLLGIIAALGAGVLARREGGPRAAIFAVVMVAVSPVFVISTWTYHSHVPSAALAVLSAYLLEIGLERDNPRKTAALLGMGLCGGLLFSVRPLTAAALGLLGAVRVLWSWRGLSPAAFVTSRLALIVGFTLPAALTFAANKQMYGTWHTFGYSLVHGALSDLGFGIRGYRLWDTAGRPELQTEVFTAGTGLAHTVTGGLEIISVFFPLALVMILLAARKGMTRTLWWWLAGSAAVIAAHGLWFHRSIRFYYDVLPLIAAATAVQLARVSAMHRTWKAVMLQIGVVGSAAVAGKGFADRTWTANIEASFTHIAALAPAGERVLLAVDATRDKGEALHALYVLNSPRHNGRFVVVRDIGLSDDSLRALFPGRTRYRVRCEPCSANKLALQPMPRFERF